MDKALAKRIVDEVAQDLLEFKFSERHDNVNDNIVGVVKKSWGPLCRIFGGHGMSVVVVVPDSVIDHASFKIFFQDLRKEINSRFIGFAAYKSSHSFIVLLCSHRIFVECSGIASELKDRSGLHMNIIQGVILVDSETKEVVGDCSCPAQNKRKYEAVLAATVRAVKM